MHAAYKSMATEAMPVANDRKKQADLGRQLVHNGVLLRAHSLQRLQSHSFNHLCLVFNPSSRQQVSLFKLDQRKAAKGSTVQ